MMSCVAAFDVTLSTKANKTQLTMFKEQVKDEYFELKEWAKIRLQLEEAEAIREKNLKAELAAMKKQREEMVDLIQGIVDDKTARKLAAYERVARMFQKFFD